MSKLDELFDEIYQDKNTLGDYPLDRDIAKQVVKALFLELIGEDQKYKSSTRDSDVIKNGRIRSRNDYKAELRKKVGEL